MKDPLMNRLWWISFKLDIIILALIWSVLVAMFAACGGGGGGGSLSGEGESAATVAASPPPLPLFQFTMLQHQTFTAQQVLTGQFNTPLFKISTRPRNLILDVLDGDVTGLWFEGFRTALLVRDRNGAFIPPLEVVVRYDPDGVAGIAQTKTVPWLWVEKLQDNATKLVVLDHHPIPGSTYRVRTATERSAPVEVPVPTQRGGTRLVSPSHGDLTTFSTNLAWDPRWSRAPSRQLVLVMRGPRTTTPSPTDVVLLEEVAPAASLWVETAAQRLPAGDLWWTVWGSDGTVDTPRPSAATFRR